MSIRIVYPWLPITVAKLHMMILHGHEEMFKREMAQEQSNKSLQLTPKVQRETVA